MNNPRSLRAMYACDLLSSVGCCRASSGAEANPNLSLSGEAAILIAGYPLQLPSGFYAPCSSWMLRRGCSLLGEYIDRLL